jgi:hypothetical protein
MQMEAVNEATEEKQGEFRLAVDTMHNGIRLAVMGTFLGGGIVGFVGGIALLPNLLLIAAITGIATATGGAFAIEKVLKERWPSGRELLANSERIALTKHNKIEAVIDCQQHVNVLTWQFKIKKDSPRAKKGWHLVALALEQDDNYIIIYSAASPEEFENLPLSSSFTKLERKKKETKKKTKAVANMREAGEQRRLQTAEFVRGMDGGDINLDQFIEYIEFLQANYPQWMLS